MTLMPAQSDVPPITLAHRLRIAREWRDLEQIDVARELGISRATVSNYERGHTAPGKLVINAWAVVCGVNVEWLKNDDLPQQGGPDGGASVTDRPCYLGEVVHADFGQHSRELRHAA